MAEPAAAPGGALNNRRVIIIAVVATVVLAAVFLFFFRGCMPGQQAPAGYEVIYSNLELKDAANVVTRLKELGIKYEVRDQGQAVAVPSGKVDTARLGLAEKNLPTGGSVGWEIFDEARLGATDFDRRIQLIRAMSGELSRTIRQIEGIEDARVQIVLPETKLFEVAAAPVTASVLLRLAPGARLTSSQVNGIIHLVASSVENLQPENVIIIDDSGNILTVKRPYVPPARLKMEKIEVVEEGPEVKETIEVEEVEVVPVPVETQTAEAATLEARVLSPEEKILLKVQAKKELERNMTGKVQELLNGFYPPNSVIVKLNLDFNGPDKVVSKSTKTSHPYEIGIKKMSVILLVDDRIELSPDMKDATYKTVAATVGYDRKRGDRIIIRKVPFHLASPPPEILKAEVQKIMPEPVAKEEIIITVVEEEPQKPAPFLTPSAKALMLRVLVFGTIILLSIFIIILIFKSIFGRKKEDLFADRMGMETRPVPSAPPASGLEQIKDLADVNPEKIAGLLKNWLSQ